MTSLAWSDVAIMAGCSLAFVLLLAVVETASQAPKRRRHAREARHRRHVVRRLPHDRLPPLGHDPVPALRRARE